MTPEVTDLKGCLNAADLNRIEGNIDYLQTELNLTRPGALLHLISKVDWSVTDIPSREDVLRILVNLRSMRWKVHPTVLDQVPELPDTVEDYADLNKIEKTLDVYLDGVIPVETWEEAKNYSWGNLKTLTWEGVAGGEVH
jgi:hypothetical protein